METQIFTIQGHEVKIVSECGLEGMDLECATETICNEIISGTNSGDNETFVTKTRYSWEIVVFDNTDTYINNKIKKLQEDEEVIFEFNELIFKAQLRSDGDYEIEVFDLDSFTSGGSLDAIECHFIEGSASEAIINICQEYKK
jgi:hypothetical protein